MKAPLIYKMRRRVTRFVRARCASAVPQQFSAMPRRRNQRTMNDDERRSSTIFTCTYMPASERAVGGAALSAPPGVSPTMPVRAAPSNTAQLHNEKKTRRKFQSRFHKMCVCCPFRAPRLSHKARARREASWNNPRAMTAVFGGTRSCFGDQTVSRRKSAPSYGFGSGTRDVASKVFISHEHEKTAARSFSPGPAGYTLRNAVGSQTESNSRSAPQWAFGTSDRFAARSKGTAPGPGAYDARTAVGSQVSSKNKTAPIFGFGSATRDHVKTVYVSEEHNKALYGVQSPGPMSYNLTSAVGKQVCARAQLRARVRSSRVGTCTCVGTRVGWSLRPAPYGSASRPPPPPLVWRVPPAPRRLRTPLAPRGALASTDAYDGTQCRRHTPGRALAHTHPVLRIHAATERALARIATPPPLI